jgi:hypothetical protein
MRSLVRQVRAELPRLAIDAVIAAVAAYLGLRAFGWLLAVVFGLAGAGAIVWALVHGFRQANKSRAGIPRGAA